MTHTTTLRIGNIKAFAGWGAFNRRLDGMPVNMMVYDITPATLAANNIAASQSPGAGAILLNGSLALANGSVKLDVPRSLQLVSGGNDSGITFTVIGFDGYGVAQVETITGANAGTAASLKAFYIITSITHTGTVAGTLTVGTGDKFGLPAQVLQASDITFSKWSTALAMDAGTLAVADTTSPATATTGDTRGTYLPSSASNGTRKLRLGIYLPTPGTYSSLRGVRPYGG